MVLAFRTLRANCGPMITPVILCGGSGTRLWPLSRKSYPKQFSQLTGKLSLFQQTAQRFAGAGYAAPVIVTNAEFRFIVTQQLQEVGIDPAAVLIEPEGRNTAPAILAAAQWIAAKTPEVLMLVTPSDHAIPDGPLFCDAVSAGVSAAEAGKIVTFGIDPTHAETGYGYLELAEPLGSRDMRPYDLKGFAEKPDATRAQAMFEGGCHLWNAGVFLTAASGLLAACNTHAPDLGPQVAEAIAQGQSDLGFFRLAPVPWAEITPISIDYAVMEKSQHLSVVPFFGVWSDLGDWRAIKALASDGGQQTATSGAAIAIDCEDSLLRAEADTQTVVGIGLKNVVVVAMPDAVLVADIARSQDVKDAVEELRARQLPQAEAFPKDHRPWGWVEQLVSGDRFQVKRIHVNPGGVLSLQSHHHRAEHWTVVKGTAKITLGEDVKLLSENESAFVPLGQKHRLENPGKVPVVIIETQTGSYLGEDDIVRYDDVYHRG